MNEKEIIEKLIPYQSGGNYFLLYKVIKDNSNNEVCELTQQELADKLQKTRKFVYDGLKILEQIGAVEFSYKNIKILGEDMKKQEKKEALRPFMKWAGGKEGELSQIIPRLPKKINRFYEPFLGGGAVFFAMRQFSEIKEFLVNDKSTDLFQLYSAIKAQNPDFVKSLTETFDNWKKIETLVEKHQAVLKKDYKDYSNTKDKDDEDTASFEKYQEKFHKFLTENDKEIKSLITGTLSVDQKKFIDELKRGFKGKVRRMKKIEAEKGKLSESDLFDNIETIFKSSFYMYYRDLYNKRVAKKFSIGVCATLFYFIREFCYASMFRFNSSGDFNVPYGGISYNRKDMSKKVSYLKSKDLVEHLNSTTIENLDFHDFLAKHPPKADDFLFLDPPYDSEFSSYDKNDFTQHDQSRLVEALQKTKANFMVVIKNTPFIKKIYSDKGFFMYAFDKTYLVSFKDRNERDCEHLLITNYEIDLSDVKAKLEAEAKEKKTKAKDKTKKPSKS